MLMIRKQILIPGKSPSAGLDDTAITAEMNILLNFLSQKKIFCLNIH